MRTTTGNPSILRGTQLFGYKFKLMNRNFIQGHPFHLVEPSPYLLLVSSALLCTTLSGVMTFLYGGYSNEGIYFLLPGFFSIILAMELWFHSCSLRSHGYYTIAAVRKWFIFLLFAVRFNMFFLYTLLVPTVILSAYWSHDFLLIAELLVRNIECLLIVFLIVSFILSHSYTICEFLIPFLWKVVISLLYFLTFGRLTYVYKVIEFKVISKRQQSIITAYRINKHYGTLIPRLVRHYFRVLAAIGKLPVKRISPKA